MNSKQRRKHKRYESRQPSIAFDIEAYPLHMRQAVDRIFRKGVIDVEMPEVRIPLELNWERLQRRFEDKEHVSINVDFPEFPKLYPHQEAVVRNLREHRAPVLLDVTSFSHSMHSSHMELIERHAKEPVLLILPIKHSPMLEAAAEDYRTIHNLKPRPVVDHPFKIDLDVTNLKFDDTPEKKNGD